MADTVSCSMFENFEVSVEMCQGFEESKCQTKKSHCRTSLLCLGYFDSNSLEDKLVFINLTGYDM